VSQSVTKDLLAVAPSEPLLDAGVEWGAMVKIHVGLGVDASKRRWHAQVSVLAMEIKIAE